MHPTPAIFGQLGLALLLGLLVGLQREHVAATTGLRTFPLITVLGTVAALLGAAFGGWIVAAGFVAIIILVTTTKVARLHNGDETPGTTTDVAALVMYAVGALLVVVPLEIGVAIGGGVAVLLQFKPELHVIARRLGDADLQGIMQFVLITCVILPVLPNETFGPLGVFNPFETWLMVVLIVGMSLGGYITYKFFGQDAGILLSGALGGAISSTATTVSSSRQARAGQVSASAAATIILIATTISYVRLAIEIAVVSPEFLGVVAGPLGVLAALTAVPALALWIRLRRRQPAPTMPEQGNPTQLKSALFFGLMYALVLFALAAAKRHLGDGGLYAVAALSGMTEMDAITLSTARLARAGDPMILADGWRILILASMANMAFKMGVAGLLAPRRMLVPILLLFALPLAGGVLLLLYWPGV